MRGRGQITEFERGYLLSSRWSTFSDGKLRVRCLNREAYGGGAIEVGAGIGMGEQKVVSMRTGGVGWFSSVDNARIIRRRRRGSLGGGSRA